MMQIQNVTINLKGNERIYKLWTCKQCVDQSRTKHCEVITFAAKPNSDRKHGMNHNR